MQIHFHLQFLLIYILPAFALESQAKLPQAATSLVIHLSGVTQNFIHFYLQNTHKNYFTIILSKHERMESIE